MMPVPFTNRCDHALNGRWTAGVRLKDDIDTLLDTPEQVLPERIYRPLRQ
jgi:hypothetical protein